jgi:uncharacterized protein (DUF2141 family)
MMPLPKLLVILVILAVTTSTAFAQDSSNQQHVLRVQLDGFRNDKGQAHCSIFNDQDPAAFPEQEDKWFKDLWMPSIKNAYAEADFTGLPPGKYAVVCYHDENSNGKFDEGPFRMPKEGYCFSNNVKPRFSAPKFDECSFDYKGGDQSIAMTMIY